MTMTTVEESDPEQIEKFTYIHPRNPLYLLHLILQDLCTYKVHVIGKEEEGLYTLFSTKKLSPVIALHSSPSCSPDSTTWHLRLGHAPAAVLHKIDCLKPTLQHTQSFYSCPVCPLARQTKLHFPSY
ncbi:hypothetical protein AABB24_003785 [Solanum stoloniferum]|uniref:GAG-pre-integrase domain-containing protein n=1 Tax=Solanum stoloniferum TaxID=62892 RepID=A0ABD2VB03_9SOLN